MIVLFNRLNNTIGDYPLLNRIFPDDGLRDIEELLAGGEITFVLKQSVTYSKCAHCYHFVS